MIPVRIVMRATAPDTFASPAAQQRLIDAIEALVQAEGFDDTDTTFNDVGQGVTPAGTRIYLLEEGDVTVGKNGLLVRSTITRDAGDPAEIGTSSRHGASFQRWSRLREDGGEELLAMVLVKPWERMRHLGEANNYSEWQVWGRDPRRRRTRDDDEFFLALSIDPDGIHFHAPIFLHGMQVIAAIATALPPGFHLADARDDTDDRALLQRILSTQEHSIMVNYDRVVVEVDQQHPELLRANTHETDAAYLWHLATALNAADPSRPCGFLSKSAGENGYTWPNGVRTSHDAICFSDGERFDCISGAGDGTPARPAWQGPQPARPSNVYVPIGDVPAPSGGTVPGPTPTPGAGWEPKHSDLLARFPAPAVPSADYVRRVAEQFSFSFPGEGWGHKKASENRPPSSDVMARQTSGGLIGYRIIPRSLSSAPITLAGQVFIPVTPQNHLGVPGPSPTPGPTPAPQPTPPPPPPIASHDAAFYTRLVAPILANYTGRGEPVNSGIGEWIWRTVQRVDHDGMTLEQSIAQTLAEMPPVPK